MITSKKHRILGVVVALATVAAAACGSDDSSEPAEPDTTEAPAATEAPADDTDTDDTDDTDTTDTTAAAPETTEAAAPVETISVDLAQSSEGMSHAALYVARALDTFGDVGLEVEFSIAGNDANTQAAVDSGVEFGSSTGINQLAAIGAGRPFAMMSQLSSNSYTIQMRADLAEEVGFDPSSSVAERTELMVGRRLGVFGVGGASDLVTRNLLIEAGYDPDSDAEIIAAGNPTELQQIFREGQVDIAVIVFPAAAQNVVDGFAVNLFSLHQGDVDWLRDNIHMSVFTTQSMLENEPETVSRMYRALDLAMDAMQDDPEGIRELLYTEFFSETDRAVFDVMWDELYPAFPAEPIIRDEAFSVLSGLADRFGFEDGASVTFDEAVVDPAVAEGFLAD